MKYIFSKLIFIPLTIIILIGIIWVGFGQGLMELEDNHIKMFRTENMSCVSHNINGVCEIILFNGSIVKLKVGENLILNQYNKTLINLLNYGIWLLIIKSLLINHFLFNRGYNFKKKI